MLCPASHHILDAESNDSPVEDRGLLELCEVALVSSTSGVAASRPDCSVNLLREPMIGNAKIESPGPLSTELEFAEVVQLELPEVYPHEDFMLLELSRFFLPAAPRCAGKKLSGWHGMKPLLEKMQMCFVVFAEMFAVVPKAG